MPTLFKDGSYTLGLQQQWQWPGLGTAKPSDSPDCASPFNSAPAERMQDMDSACWCREESKTKEEDSTPCWTEKQLVCKHKKWLVVPGRICWPPSRPRVLSATASLTFAPRTSSSGPSQLFVSWNQSWEEWMNERLSFWVESYPSTLSTAFCFVLHAFLLNFFFSLLILLLFP